MRALVLFLRIQMTGKLMMASSEEMNMKSSRDTEWKFQKMLESFCRRTEIRSRGCLAT